MRCGVARASRPCVPGPSWPWRQLCTAKMAVRPMDETSMRRSAGKTRRETNPRELTGPPPQGHNNPARSRRGAGAADRAALEMPCARKGTVGSNPTLSVRGEGPCQDWAGPAALVSLGLLPPRGGCHGPRPPRRVSATFQLAWPCPACPKGGASGFASSYAGQAVPPGLRPTLRLAPPDRAALTPA